MTEGYRCLIRAHFGKVGRETVVNPLRSHRNVDIGAKLRAEHFSGIGCSGWDRTQPSRGSSVISGATRDELFTRVARQEPKSS